MILRQGIHRALAAPAVLVLVYWAYVPGLRGGFLFDDFANLPSLGESGPVNNWLTFWRYVTSGIADPTGRPLTLLSFLIDAHDWPAVPYPFKRTNLILHLLNGVLLYALLKRLGQSLTVEIRRCRMAAIIGSSLWLLHPLLVSTTLYIVQREAILPGTCALAGLLIWLHGRSQLSAGNTRKGLFWSAFGLGSFTVLGILAKANGALLPIYALLIETIVLAPRHRMPTDRLRLTYRTFLLIFAQIPAAAVATYLIWIGVHGIIKGGPALRPWTYAERLLTEPRVVLDYLWQLWVPRPFSNGLFNDQYVASTSLWHPITTLPAILAVLALIAAAWRLRQRYPAVALTVLFYFAGQLLESTSIPLELYFEHRNYVPAMLMFWPLGLWLSDTRSLTILKRCIAITLPLGLALLTHMRAEVWGNVDTQAMIWARLNPDSPRAQANAAQIEMQTGRPQQAEYRLEKLLQTRPEESQLALNFIGARCMSGGVRPQDRATALTSMKGSPNVGPLFAHWFEGILPIVMGGGCPGLTPKDLLDFINAGLRNPKLGAAGPQQDLIYLRGRIDLAQHEPDAALSNYKQALDLQVRPDMALQAAADLGRAGYPKQGLLMLDHYNGMQKDAMPPSPGMPMVHAWVLARQNYWPHELAHLRNQLKLDARDLNADTSGPAHDSGTTH